MSTALESGASVARLQYQTGFANHFATEALALPLWFVRGAVLGHGLYRATPHQQA
jgi:hypothetical protein